MNSTVILDLAIIGLFYWMAFRALITGRIRVNLGVFSLTEKAWIYWAIVSLYLLLGIALLLKVVFNLLTAAA